jgi:hypothetical protein
MQFDFNDRNQKYLCVDASVKNESEYEIKMR